MRAKEGTRGLVGATVLAIALALPSTAVGQVAGPTDLEVTDVTATSFTLKWSEPADTRGLYGYSVRDANNPAVNNQIGWGFTTTTTVDAKPQTTYRVAVRTSYINHPDGIAESEPSNVVTLTTPPDTEPPEAPALRLQRKTATSVIFNRDLASDNVGLFAPDYVIEINGGERFAEFTSAVWSWGVQDLVSNATHSFRVKAIDAAGNESAWSDPVSVAIEDEPPTVPANIRVEGDRAVWDPSTDNSGQLRYEVFMGGDFHISTTTKPQDDFRFWTDVAEASGPGEHLFTVEAVDSSQNRSGHSDPFVIAVD
jgi:hypothetical protein